MKVICIDASNQFSEGSIKEGVVYDVSECRTCCGRPAYLVHGLVGQTECAVCESLNAGPIYRQHRFTPLSTIDETELQQQRECSLITN